LDAEAAAIDAMPEVSQHPSIDVWSHAEAFGVPVAQGPEKEKAKKALAEKQAKAAAENQVAARHCGQ